MQEKKVKLDYIYDPNQLFPIPYTLISNIKKTLTSLPLKQPFAYEVYCPISCKKVKIGVAKENTKEGIQFNTTSSRWVSVYVNNNIKYLVNEHNPVKKDKKKAQGQNWSIYLQVQDKGNYAIFNPFYVDPSDPLSFYTFNKISKAFKPEKKFFFLKNQNFVECEQIKISNKTIYLRQSQKGVFISHNKHFEDEATTSITLLNPLNREQVIKGSPQEFKKIVDQNLTFWLWNLNQIFINEQSGKSQQINFNLDQIYQNLSFYLNLDEQIRRKLMNSVGIKLLKQLYKNQQSHPRLYCQINRLVSFFNYGNTKYDVKKLAAAGFYNKSDMLQDIAYIQFPHVPIPNAEQSGCGCQVSLREKMFPMSRINRKLAFPNIQLKISIEATHAQTITTDKIIYKDQTNKNYLLFVDSAKKLTLWTSKILVSKLLQIDLINPIVQQKQLIFNEEIQSKVQQNLLGSAQINDPQSLADIFGEIDVNSNVNPKDKETGAQIIPEQSMVDQLLSMGYGLNIVKKALIKVKNESVPVALDEIEKITAEEKAKFAAKKAVKTQWSCQYCTYVNSPTADSCQICNQIPNFQDIQQLERLKKEREQQEKAEEQKKKQQEKKQQEKQQAQKLKKQKEEQQSQILRKREQFYQIAQITSVKLFKTQQSAIDPFIFLVLFTNKIASKSILKIIRVGYNRTHLTKFYRYQQGVFISNLTRSIHPKKDLSISSINQIIKQSWDRIQNFNRLIEPFHKNQFIIVDVKQFSFEQIWTSIKLNQQTGFYMLENQDKKSTCYQIKILDDLTKTNFQTIQAKWIENDLQLMKGQQQKVNHSHQHEGHSHHHKHHHLHKKSTESQVIKGSQNCSTQIKLPKNTFQVTIQAVQHLPSSKWKSLKPYTNNFLVDSKLEGEVVMSEYLPLTIQHFDGSVFSSKYYSTSILERSNLYISNYPEASFTFKSLTSKPMMVETITVISTNKRLQKIFPVQTGLIFTANQISWFQFAKKKFRNFKKKQYEEWLNTKKDRNGYREFWQPVGFFQIQNQIQIQLDYKRTAKYIFLLPTSVRTTNDKIDIAALKIDFFGVKGRIEEEISQNHQNPTNNFKSDCESYCEIDISQNGKKIEENSMIVYQKSGTNSFNFLPTNTEGFNQLPLSVSTVFNIKFLESQHQKIVSIKSPYLSKITYKVKDLILSQKQKEQVQIKSYKQLVDLVESLTERQIQHYVQKFQVRQLLLLLLSNLKTFRPFQKLLKIIIQIPNQKERLFQSMTIIIPELCEQNIKVSEHGLKTYLRTFDKLYQTNNDLTFKTLCKSWKNITLYVQKIRNKNYVVLRNKYNIQELILEPNMFSKDYYRLIHPAYVQDQPVVSTIVAQPKTELNNVYYLHKLNPFYYKSFVDIKQEKYIQRLKIFFPKIVQPVNRYKLMIKVYILNDQISQNYQKLVYYRYFNQQALVQFSVYAFKDNQIYNQNRINYLTIPINHKGRVLRIQYNYLLLTTLPHLKYKQPTEQLVLFPIVQSKSLIQFEKEHAKHQLNQHKHTYEIVEKMILAQTFPQQVKHSSCIDKIPPFKYTTQGQKSLYNIHEFPVLNQQSISKEYSQMVDKITTNIMDKAIIDECLKSIKISNYQFNKKGTDFGYTLLINLMKVFKKLSTEYSTSVQLLLQMFDTFVIYQIGPIHKKVMGFISQVYKRLTSQEKCEFVQKIIVKYLTSMQKIQSLKQNQKYSLSKIIEKLSELSLPITHLMFMFAQSKNNKLLKSSLLKLIKPNIQKFSINNLNYVVNGQKKTYNFSDLIFISFNFCLWVLDEVKSIKKQMLLSGLQLLLTLMTGKNQFIQKNKEVGIKEFINKVDQNQIWKLVFLTLKLKNEELKSKVHSIFTMLIENTTEKFSKGINLMLLEIIKKDKNSIYSKINGDVSDEIWMNHLQTILEYLNITNSSSGNKKQFFLDIDTAICLLQLPLTQVLWSLVLLIIPRDDKILISIIKNFKKQFQSSLGKQITKFCQPLAGIRSLQTIHVNWLDLVKKIRLQGFSVFELFLDELNKCWYGGKDGLTMATFNQIKQLQITVQFSKLTLEHNINQSQYTEKAIKKIISWYYLNSTTEKGISPATQKLKTLSQNVLKLIQKFNQTTTLVPLCIKTILIVKKQSQCMQGLFQQKHIPTHTALSLNKRFCTVFEQLLNIFMTTDQLSSYFAFDIKGLDYIMSRLNLTSSSQKLFNNSNQFKNEQISLNDFNMEPEQEFLMGNGLMSKNEAEVQQLIQIKSLNDLKEEQFANNVKLVPNMNNGVTTAVIDWTVYKKGTKTKVIYLPMIEKETYFEFPLYIQLGRQAQVRSIKIGFPFTSFEFTDQLIVSPYMVTVEGSIDLKNFEPLGQMSFIQDDGYMSNGVKVFALNLQKIRPLSSQTEQSHIGQSIRQFETHRVKYLKIVVKRPIVSFIQGQYSPLNGKFYNTLGVNICFLSVIGDDISKLPSRLVDSCREQSKKVALTLLSSLLNQANASTMKRISNQETFSQKFKQNFSSFNQLMTRYKQTVPQIIYALGSNNEDLGDWLIEQFIKIGKDQIQGKIINQIIISTPNKIYKRINYFQVQLFKKLQITKNQSQIQSSLLFNRLTHFMQSFCKTLQECYETQFSNNGKSLKIITSLSSEKDVMKQRFVLDCNQQKINTIIDIYDKKYSSPQIKSLVKMLIALIWIKKPLQLAQQVKNTTLDIIWKNCSQSKPYFYNLMSSLLVSRQCEKWISLEKHRKSDELILQIKKSIETQNEKALKSQIFLLSILSYHQRQYLRSNKVHLELYDLLKVKCYPDFQIYQSLLKIVQNSILGYPQQEQKLASIMIKDVELLVRRKDPILQKLFVGILALQRQVMINIKGIDLKTHSSKKIQYVNSKILNRAEQKAVAQVLGSKKLKYTLTYQTTQYVKSQDKKQFVNSLYANHVLLIFAFSRNKIIYHCGMFCSAKPIKNQEEEYCWEQQVMSDKTSFFFVYAGEGKNTQHQYLKNNVGQKMLSIYQCDQEDDHNITAYHNGNEIFKFSSDPNNAILVSQSILAKGGNISMTKCQLISLQLFECKPAISGVKSDKKVFEFLSKSNQAKSPFTWYRFNQIYLFPGNISLNKLQKLLSLRATTSQDKSFQQQNLLSNLEDRTDDFIVDINVNGSQQFLGQEQFGYIPKMNIFDCFSRLDGLNQVLRLGSASIKQWKNVQRKKNFEHYMEELKSFIHLPNFFSLFIKNHQYVTFLFEVASGMPDDTNSTRNWQEQEVNSSRFIYKILSDIFKFDRSAALRNMDTYNDFCDIILDKLAQISKQVPRVFKEQLQAQQQVNQLGIQKIQKKKSEQNKKRKKKGTGYGADNQNNNSKWSSTQWLQNKKLRSQQILRVVSIIVSFLDCQTPLEDQRIAQTLKSSCLLPLIQSSLRSGSLLDISKQADLFKNYLVLIRNIAKNPSTVSCLIQIQKNYKPEQTESIHALLSKLHNISQIFLECLKSGKSAPDADQTTQSIALDIQMTFAIIDKAVKKMKKNQNVISIKQINEMPLMQAYRILLSNLRFGYINLKKPSTNTYQHAHATSITGVSPSTQKILRLSQELADLSSSLPCQHTNSIFVRCDKSRIDVIKVLIMGSKDTPYSNGAFMFDVFCDDSYPNNPPKMLITTTGQGKIRFNPNLYSCGKVCLSLLGTWRGLASQNWDPKLSTLLQLFISTQGITMSEDVYFNEPGFDGEQGTDEGQKKNQAYSNIVRLGNVRHAMIDQIKNPPKGFQDVINRHFYIKRKQILEECEKWLEYAQKRQASYTGLVADHNNSWCAQLKTTKTKYKELLEIQVKTLRQLLSKLPQPNLKQKDQEEQIKEQSAVKKKKHRQGKDVKFGQIDVGYDKNQNQKEQKIEDDVMQDRWSRYIGAMGLQAVKKQASSNVLLLGLKPLGLEIAKNLILSGLAKLTIVQNDVISGHQEHFYMSDMKGKKIQQCIFKLKELNPYMIVDHRQSFPQTVNLKKYNLVVSTLNIDQSLKISQICRAQSIKFIYTQTCGVYGNYFADLGKSFQINDSNGQQPFQGLIQSISCDEKGVVKLLDGVKHPYEDGDYIVINKVQGMEIIKQQMEQISQAQAFYNKMIQTTTLASKSAVEESIKPSSINGKIFKIKVLNWNSFSIGDTTNFTPYLRNGLCKNIKIPKKIQYKSFNQCTKDFQKYLDPNMGIYDFQKMGDNLSIYICFTALSKFVQQNKRRPNNWNVQDCQQFMKIIQEILQPYKKSQEERKVILQFAQKFSSICESQLPSIGAYLGGLVSQQVIKALTNKYTPINQFFTFQLNELIQKVQNNTKESWKNYKIDKDQPFRNIKIVVGKENMKKIEQMNLFVVGAGAIGCELLKNFAMVNMSAQGKMTVTDPDHIETSNLTRQFLFRQKHVKNPKSATASATLIQMNPNLKNHIVARLDKVCEQTEDIYSDEFFKKQTIIANALDNVKARQYVDKRCVVNKIPLFESGTLGPKGHVQVIVPYKTQNYGSQADPSEEAQIPHCTLKMFPEDTTHCIQWSRDIFGKIFTLDPKALKKLIQSKDSTSLQGKQKQTIIKMIKYHPKSFQDCINQAVRIFFKHFRNNIRQLLYTYPIDMKTKEGKLFWTLPKRPPQQINKLDAKDQMHRTFIASYAVLFAKIFSIQTPKDFRKPQGRDRIMEHAVQVKIEDFVPSAEKSKQLQELTDKQQKNKEEQIIEQEHMANVKPLQEVPIKQEQQIKLTSSVLELSIMPQEFEKDQDSNGHIDLIYSMSNLRARNYELAECTWIQAKLKAGRIMAALSTTTSVVAALQAIQIIKLVTGSQIWRNAFVNLAVPLIQISEPGPATKQKIGNTQFSVWEDWQFKAPTLKDLIFQMEEKYQVEGFNISTSEGKPIYWETMYKQKQQAKEALLSKSLKSLLGHGQKYQLNILMRNPKQKQKIYQKVPKVIIYPS